MHLVTVILGLLLFPKTSALKCYECIPGGATGSCTETQKDCPASQQCGAARVSVGGIDVKMKGCIPPAECDLSGSMNFGVRVLLSSKCCSTALCNVQYPPPPASSSSPNGNKCYTCKDKDCFNMLSCSGDEDRCFSSRVGVGGSEIITKGCISKSLCVSSATDTPTIPGITAQVRCCEGKLCNSATGTAASLLLLLVAPVLSVSLFN